MYTSMWIPAVWDVQSGHAQVEACAGGCVLCTVTIWSLSYLHMYVCISCLFGILCIGIPKCHIGPSAIISSRFLLQAVPLAVSQFTIQLERPSSQQKKKKNLDRIFQPSGLPWCAGTLENSHSPPEWNVSTTWTIRGSLIHLLHRILQPPELHIRESYLENAPPVQLV